MRKTLLLLLCLTLASPVFASELKGLVELEGNRDGLDGIQLKFRLEQTFDDRFGVFLKVDVKEGSRRVFVGPSFRPVPSLKLMPGIGYDGERLLVYLKTKATYAHIEADLQLRHNGRTLHHKLEVVTPVASRVSLGFASEEEELGPLIRVRMGRVEVDFVAGYDLGEHQPAPAVEVKWRF